MPAYWLYKVVLGCWHSLKGYDMSERNAASKVQKVVHRSEVVDPDWVISGYGTPPSLSFEVKRDSILDSEKKSQVWTEENPQPKYQYIFNVKYTDWSSLFKQAGISTGWVIGKYCREGAYEPNAVKDDQGKIVLKEGAKAIELRLPVPRQARTPQTLEQMFAKMSEEDIARLEQLLAAHKSKQ